MANWTVLKAAIAAVIKTNGNQEITGAVLQNTLNSIVSAVGENATLAGKAAPTTNPGAPDGNVFYFATQAGTYTNFGSVELNDGLNILRWNGTSWVVTNIMTIVQELGTSGNAVISQKAVNKYMLTPSNLPVFNKDNFTILQDSVQENSILNANGSVQSYNNINVVTANLKAGDLIYLGISDTLSTVFTVYDLSKADGTIIYSQRGGAENYTSYGKFIFIPCDLVLRYSRRVNLDDYIYKVSAFNLLDLEENLENKIKITTLYAQKEAIFPLIDTLEQVAFGKGSTGLFEDTSQTIYQTSDYIELDSRFTYYLICNDQLDGRYNFFRLYDEEKNLLYRQVSGFKGLIKISPINAKYIRYIQNNNNRFTLYKTTDTYESLDNNANKINEVAGVISKFGNDVSASELGVEGIYKTDGNIDYSPLRWHTIFPATKGSYKVTTQTGLANGTSTNWYAIAFLNSKKEVIGGYTDMAVGTQYLTDYLIFAPENTAYISVSIYNKRYLPILKAKSDEYITPVDEEDLEDYATKEYVDNLVKTTTHSVLWLGTSIPEGCYYPQNACANLRYTCYNRALGSSGIILNSGVLGNGRDGKDLAESTEEKIARYQSHIGDGTSGTITQGTYNSMMNWGYDKRIIPYINGDIASCDIVVFDHGYNDRSESMKQLIENFDTLDLSVDKDDADFDRTNYIGAFCFLVKKIWEINPNIKIVICSYLEDRTGSPEFPSDPKGKYGYVVCELLKKIAKHFNFPYLNMCDYNGFTMEYVPNTSDYISSYNKEYGTSYSVLNYTGKTNTKGNVTRFQYYCPDGVHPHTDKSGNAKRILTASITKLLRDL